MFSELTILFPSILTHRKPPGKEEKARKLPYRGPEASFDNRSAFFAHIFILFVSLYAYIGVILAHPKLGPDWESKSFVFLSTTPQDCILTFYCFSF